MANDPWNTPSRTGGYPGGNFSGQPPASRPNPYAAGPPGYAPPGYGGYPHGLQPPPKSGGAWKLVAVIVGAIGLVVLACGVASFFLVRMGMGMVAESVKVELRDNAVLREHVGEIQSIDFDLMASGARDESDVFIFNVQGDKGEGVVTARLSDDDDVLWARLRLPSGEEVELVSESGNPGGDLESAYAP